MPSPADLESETAHRLTAPSVRNAWLLLAALTILATIMVRGTTGPSRSLTLIGLALVAAVKLEVILGRFMGTWRSPRWCRIAATAWVAAFAAMVIMLGQGQAS